MRTTAFALIAVVGLVSCASAPSPRQSIDERMTSWMGSTVSDLIASWGPPWRTIDVGGDGVVYVWVSELWTEQIMLPYKEKVYDSPGTSVSWILDAINAYKETHTTTSVTGFQMFWARQDG